MFAFDTEPRTPVLRPRTFTFSSPDPSLPTVSPTTPLRATHLSSALRSPPPRLGRVPRHHSAPDIYRSASPPPSHDQNTAETLRRPRSPPLGRLPLSPLARVPGFVPRIPTPVPDDPRAARFWHAHFGDFDFDQDLDLDCGDAMDDDALADRQGELLMELDALRLLNGRTEKALVELWGAPSDRSALNDHNTNPEALLEVIHLLRELDARASRIIEIDAELGEVRRRIAARPPTESVVRSCPADSYAEPAADTCHYCVDRPANVVYTCCQHRGACYICALTMRERTSLCPHCRASSPKIQGLDIPDPI